MTVRLYYTDPGCAAFEAVVTGSFILDGRPAVTLDRTAFYPTSGGQPFDLGTLAVVGHGHEGTRGFGHEGTKGVGHEGTKDFGHEGTKGFGHEGTKGAKARVVDVVGREDGSIVHVLESVLAEGVRVQGTIDWPRRFDHMQQHTGQHVLSAAFDRLFGNRTVSFHMGGDASTLDLANEAQPGAIAAAEQEANRIVWEDRPVSIRFASPEEAAALPLRKEPARGGTLRLIEIDGYDLSACGGTHVSRTGAIGIVAVTAWERFRGGSRLTFVCGNRALRALRTYRDAVAGSIRSLSVLPEELPGAIERVQAESKDLRRTVKAMQEALAGHEAARLVAEAPLAGGVRVVVRALEGWDAAGLKAIAAAAASASGVAAALFSATQPTLVVVARSADVAADAQAILKALVAEFGGRGGGTPDFAQGGGLKGDPGRITAAAREAIERQVSA